MQRRTVFAVSRASFVALTLASLTISACGSRRVRGRGGEDEPLACESALAYVRTPDARWALSGHVRTAPGTTVFLNGFARNATTQSVADAQGQARFDQRFEQFESPPSALSVQCGFVTVRGNRSIRAAPSRQLFFVDDHHPGYVVCEGRRCEIGLSVDHLSFTAPAGARLTLDGQSVVASGTAQRIEIAPTWLDGVPIGARRTGTSGGGDGWDEYTRLRPSKTVALQLSDGTTLQRTLHLTSRAVTSAYGAKFEGVASRAVLPADAPRGQGALYFSGRALMQVYGPVQRFSDVAYVAIARQGEERRASCGRYRRGTQTITVDRVMRDGVMEVFDPRTARKLYSETIRAPERRCQSSMHSVVEVMSEYDALAAENAFARWYAQRSGGNAPGTLGFDTVSEVVSAVAPSADGGAADASSESTAPADAPDPALRAAVSERVTPLGYTVTTATSSVDAVSGAMEHRVVLSHGTHLSTDITMVEYDRDHRPGRSARFAMHGNSVTIVDPTEGTTLTDPEYRSMLAISGSPAAVSAGLRRNHFNPDSEPSADDDFEGGIEVSATAGNGDRGVALTVRNYAGVPRGGDDPRALRVVGNRVWRASGNDTRAELDRVLRAVAR